MKALVCTYIHDKFKVKFQKEDNEIKAILCLSSSIEVETIGLKDFFVRFNEKQYILKANHKHLDFFIPIKEKDIVNFIKTLNMNYFYIYHKNKTIDFLEEIDDNYQIWQVKFTPKSCGCEETLFFMP